MMDKWGFEEKGAGDVEMARGKKRHTSSDRQSRLARPASCRLPHEWPASHCGGNGAPCTVMEAFLT
jgi:hypothetical protein